VRFQGNLISTRVQHGETLLRVVSVHSPAWEIDRSRLAGIDKSAVQLALSPDVWLSDCLWATLPREPSEAWIVGGDFNLSETFDAWKGGPRGNREYLERMAARGFTECLREVTGRVTPTFRNT